MEVTCLLKKKWVRALFRQRFLIILLLALQPAFLVYVLVSSSLASVIVSRVLTFISVLVSVLTFVVGFIVAMKLGE